MKTLEEYNYYKESPIPPLATPHLKITLDDYQLRSVYFFTNVQRGLLADKQGLGKCIPGNCRIQTNRGYIRMSDLMISAPLGFSDPEDNIYVSTPFGEKRIDKFYRESKAECLKIHLSNGRIIYGTPEHQILSINDDGDYEMAKLSTFKEGTKIPVISFIQDLYSTTSTCPLTDETIYFISRWLVSDEMSFRVPIADSEIKFIGGEHFPNGLYYKDGYLHSGDEVLSKSKEIFKDFLSTGDKTFPEIFYEMGNSQKYSFLRALLDVTLSFKRPLRIQGRHLAYGISDILDSMGVAHTIQYSERSYQIEICREMKYMDFCMVPFYNVWNYMKSTNRVKSSGDEIYRVTKIEKYLDEVYDISLGKHLYLAQGLINHNTCQSLGIISNLLHLDKISNALIVCPASAVIGTWAKELSNSTTFNFVTLMGGKGYAERKYKMSQVNSRCPIAVVNYECFRIDAFKGLFDFDCVIFDESSDFKNPFSVTAQAVNLVASRAKYVVCLNATPYETKISDVFTQVNAMFPGYLGNYEAFKNKYAVTEEVSFMKWNKARTRKFRMVTEQVVGTKNLDDLKSRIDRFVMLRVPEDVGIKYPDIVPRIIKLQMTESQYETYRRILKGFVVRDGVMKSANSAARFQWLLMCCTSPSLISRGEYDPSDSPKIEAVRSCVKALINIGRRVVIFTRLRVTAMLLESVLLKDQIKVRTITGREKSKVLRLEYQNMLNNGQIDCLVINTAGAKSLNLPGASAMLFVDPTFNPALNDQALYRVLRRTSTFDKVLFYQFLIEDSVDQRVQDILEKRKQVADFLFGKETQVSRVERSRIVQQELERHLAPK